RRIKGPITAWRARRCGRAGRPNRRRRARIRRRRAPHLPGSRPGDAARTQPRGGHRRAPCDRCRHTDGDPMKRRWSKRSLGLGLLAIAYLQVAVGFIATGGTSGLLEYGYRWARDAGAPADQIVGVIFI